MKRKGATFPFRLAVGLLFCLLLGLFQNGTLQAEDSCVICHTDEEMLNESLGKKVKEKSSLQAGPG